MRLGGGRGQQQQTQNQGWAAAAADGCPHGWLRLLTWAAPRKASPTAELWLLLLLLLPPPLPSALRPSPSPAPPLQRRWWQPVDVAHACVEHAHHDAVPGMGVTQAQHAQVLVCMLSCDSGTDLSTLPGQGTRSCKLGSRVS